MSKVIKLIRNPRNAFIYLRYRIQYLRLYLKGEDRESISFYRRLQNEKVLQGEAYHRQSGIGRAQIKFLRRQGMSTTDKVLDIGCGDLRGGQYMIEFLKPSKYTGMDISEEAIKTAWVNLREEGMLDQRPRLLVNENLQLQGFEDGEFDYVFANSVLTHLPEDIIAELFDNLGRVLVDTGRACLSYHEAEEMEKNLSRYISTSNLYRYPFEDLQRLCDNHGLKAKRDPYDEHPAENMRMLIVTAP